MAIRPPSRTTQLEDLPPEDDVPTPDELVDFGSETTETFIARTGFPEPRPLAASDAVPVFRTDLKIEKGGSPGLFEVAEPDTGRHFTLYEFELSIARMLDGRRHASGVIENGVRLGIPVDLDGLNKFIRQLWRYGFLAPVGAAPPATDGEESGWGEREKWDEATRTLYQTGLRLMRQGRPEDARSYFHAVLDADPGNGEASARLGEIDRGETIAAVPVGHRTGGGRAATRARGGRRTALIALLVAGVVGVGVGVWRTRSAPPPPSPPPPAVRAERSPVPPVAWRTAVVRQRSHPVLGEVAAAASGIVIWSVQGGSAVTAGQRIGVLRIEAAGGGRAPSDPASAARIRELEALAAKDPVYRDFLEKELRAAGRGRPGRTKRELPIVASAAGRLVPAVASRARVGRDASLATIVDAQTWAIDAMLDGEPPRAEAACELRGDASDERLGCRLDGVRPQDGGSVISIRVAASEAPWLEGARSLRIRVAPPGTPPEPARVPAGGER